MQLRRGEMTVLLRFEVSNHRSINGPAELSMIAVDEDRAAARSFDLLNERVLAVAGIYGPNASGKSNVLDGLSWLAAAVSRSLRMWDDAIPRDPFKFHDGPARPSQFDVEMMVDGVRYAYTVVLDDREVLYEGLFSYPERRRRSIFEREGSDIAFRRGLRGTSGTRELLTPTTLALSAAMRFGEQEVRSFGRELADIGILGRHPRRIGSGLPGGGTVGSAEPQATATLFYEATDLEQPDTVVDEDVDEFDRSKAALGLLQFADLGIGDIQVVEETIENAGRGVRLRRIRLVHRVADQELAFNMRDESAGTQTWFRLIGPVLHALRRGRTLLFDEIDASLHPRLSAKLLELFQDPETNPRGAQLIFTSHDTSLLNHLNRDEVWLTEKNAGGATTLTALAEYGGDKVRRSLNLERAYLQGRFGAIPEIDQAALKAALGLVVEEN
jgi:hypothetical protein